MDSAYTRTLPFKTALYYMEELTGLTMDETSFEDVGFQAWKKIGNRQTCKYLIEDAEKESDEVSLDSTKYFIPLPCNVLQLEYVTTQKIRHCKSSARPELSVSLYDRTYQNELNIFSEKSGYKYVLEGEGAYIPYELMENGIVIFQKDDTEPINILYHGLVVDDEGFPKLNEKEAEAIAYYCAMIKIQKNLPRKIYDPSLLQLYQQRWSKECKNARVPEKLTQNFVDALLNVKTSMNRKTYNRSLRMYKDV